MIKATNGRIEFQGNIMNIASEVTLVLKAFRETVTEKTNEKYAIFLFDKVVKAAQMTEEDIKSECETLENKIKKQMEKVEKLIKEILADE